MNSGERAPLGVLMPVFNAGEHLEPAITSVLNQTYRDFDLIVVDDASTDGSLQLLYRLAAHDDRIRVYRNIQNLGIIETRNRLFELSAHEYWAIMDADDLCHPDRFRIQMNWLRSNPSTCVVASNVKIVPYGSRTRFSLANGRIREALLLKNVITNPSALMRASAARDRGIRYDPAVRGASDYKFWQEISEHCNFHILEDVLLDYRRHGEQESTANQDRQRASHVKVSHHFLSRLLPSITLEQVEHLIWPHKISNPRAMIEMFELVRRILSANQQHRIYSGKKLAATLKKPLFRRLVSDENRVMKSSVLRFITFSDFFSMTLTMLHFFRSMLFGVPRLNNNNPQHVALKLLRLLSDANMKDIAIYGAGRIAFALVDFIEQDGNNTTIEAIFDSKAEKTSFKFRDFEVKPPAAMPDMTTNNIVIASYEFRAEISRNIKRTLGAEHSKFNIVAL